MKKNIMAVKEYLGKIHYRCKMCHEVEFNDKYVWIGTLTKTKLTICMKCAKREGGKQWPKESQRLKKLKQKLQI